MDAPTGMRELRDIVDDHVARLYQYGESVLEPNHDAHGWDDRPADVCEICDHGLDVFDIEFTLDAHRVLIGVRFRTSVGGPTVTVDTRAKRVIGAWGAHEYERVLDADIAAKIQSECKARYLYS